MNARLAIVCASILGLTAVAAGAFGAHALSDRIDAHALEIWKTGAHYQLVHAVALLAVAAMGSPWSAARRVAAILFTVGCIVFAGTLYGLALGGPKLLGAVTPIGGLCFISGWAALIVHALWSVGPDRH